MPHPKTGKIIVCSICDKKIYRKGYKLKINKYHYCSNKCSYKGRETGREIRSKSCEYCKKIFFQRKTCSLLTWNLKVKYCSKKCGHLNLRIKLSGENGAGWKGGKKKYCRKQVLIRDRYTCQKCHLYEPAIMDVDHIKPKSCFPELAFDLNNLITLCPNCHKRKSIQDQKLYKFNQLRINQ